MNRLTTLKQMEQQQPGEPFLKYAIGLEYVGLQQDQEARKYFELLITTYGNYLPTYLHLGQLYERLGLVEQAITTYKQGIEVARSAADNKTLGELNEALLLAGED